jgi:transposase
VDFGGKSDAGSMACALFFHAPALGANKGGIDHHVLVVVIARQQLENVPSSLLKNPRHSECIVIQFFYHESVGAGMRGAFVDHGGLFSYIAPEARVPANHPLRKIRELVRDVLGELNRSLGKLYASEGRPSIPPEQLLSALLLQVFYGIQSERQLMEQLDYNLLYRWFEGLSPDDPIWDPTTFTKNRDRRQNGEVFTRFFSKLLNQRSRWGPVVFAWPASLERKRKERVGSAGYRLYESGPEALWTIFQSPKRSGDHGRGILALYL